ncbi:MAG TPA: hotdog domain-containing protein [Kofleriaceae bacterium]|nr:hotdog domain-containing protein [Kofleriaceae bacterium]
MDPRTHLAIDSTLVGTPISLEQGAAEVGLDTTDAMAVDDRGLVHGGFVFGLADYAAMLAVNDPLVVLGAAECTFLAPVRSGQHLVARARVVGEKGKKRTVEASATVADTRVFEATFTCFVLEHHVLEPKES